MDGKQSPNEEPTWQFKPGETISPRKQATEEAAQPETSSPAPAVASQASPANLPSAAPEQPSTTPSEPLPPAAQEPVAPNRPAADTTDTPQTLTWTASEFIAHDKTARWHLGLVGVAVVAAVLLWLITHDIVTAVVVVVAGAVLSLYGGRRPAELQYQLDNYGISIGQKQFSFGDFRAFSVVPEGAFASIALLPTKRFAPMTTLYFAPEDGDKILDILGDHLPEQPRKADAIDSLMRKIRF